MSVTGCFFGPDGVLKFIRFPCIVLLLPGGFAAVVLAGIPGIQPPESVLSLLAYTGAA